MPSTAKKPYTLLSLYVLYTAKMHEYNNILLFQKLADLYIEGQSGIANMNVINIARWSVYCTSILLQAARSNGAGCISRAKSQTVLWGTSRAHCVMLVKIIRIQRGLLDRQTISHRILVWTVSCIHSCNLYAVDFYQISKDLHYCTLNAVHRRRIELEGKAKVVASDWGTESLPRQLFCLGLFETNG